MNVVLVGSGPAIESVAATLGDVDVDVTRGDIDAIETADFAVVSGLAGSEGFERANDRALAGGTSWIAIEVGGIGGVPVGGLDAAVTTIQPAHACFECLRSRVAAGGVQAAEEATADRPAVRLAGSYAGLLAIRALSGDAVGGVVIEVPHAERTLLPVPHCECEHDPTRDLDLTPVSRSLDQSIALAEQAVDKRLGIIQQIGEHDSFPAAYYLSVLADTTGFSDVSAPDRAAGVGVDWDAAFMKALGESLERYSAAIVRTEDLAVDAIEAVDGPSPTDFVRPDTAHAFEPETEIQWTPGLDLITEREVSLPAGRVYFPSPDDRFDPTITTGLGLGNGSIEAVLSGLYEIIERDATMLAWYSTYDPLELDVESETFDTLARRARGEDLTVTPLVVTQDIDVPVVSVSVHREEWPRFAIGSAADLDAEVAAVDALSEAIQNWMELRGMGQSDAAEAEGSIGEYAMDPRPASAMLETAGRVSAGDLGPDPLPEGDTALQAVLDRVESAGLDVYAASLTPRDVAHMGFEALRVLSPQAQPLFVGEPFFGERATRVPEAMGFEPQLDRPFHPYP